MSSFARRPWVLNINASAEDEPSLCRGRLWPTGSGPKKGHHPYCASRQGQDIMKLSDFAAGLLPRQKTSSPEDFWQDAARCERMLYKAAFQYTGSHFDAEDLVQETFLAAFRRRYQLKDRRKFKRWLFVILRNHFLKRVGRRRGGPEQEYDDRIDYD